ncbi:hypothetical protein HN371_03090 [Candidatus Poribacteria bacterium]|nr:hypothetical protein [Candidatus Poribacteria bacterium]MBT5712692.1 hypothetical protein [Candidatus Poribacteria bacterium]MBT7806781.1 hypothetical protein [Candidatus Poribacteria bacterium]
MGWRSTLTVVAAASLVFETITGLAIAYAPFHAAVEWSVIVHTAIGVLTLLPICWYYAAHWQDYRRYALSQVVLLGYVGLVALLVCTLSGAVVTWQGLFGVGTALAWRRIHLVSTLAILPTGVAHIVLVYIRVLRAGEGAGAKRFAAWTVGYTAIALVVVVGLSAAYSGTDYVNEFPDDYAYPYGEDRPFAPSLAQTTTGGAFDSRSLAGSESCGTTGCHEQIVAEWKPSAHRYAAMDAAFQEIQRVMAEQNGAESTRYCGGCHDPISLFSGAKRMFTDNLTSQEGYQEGISCLSCHSVRETDLKGNANYVMQQPSEYLWQWSEGSAARLGRDFLIRTYPKEHGELSKSMFKAPEYCAACHKQFIDQEINRVGWVQLQNQYDNWAASHWNHEGDPTKTVECRECHMPLVDSTDPASGDPNEYNRSPKDGKHRSHRFLAANNMMPAVLKLEGWEEHVEMTNTWLRGEYSIPEIADKWREGPLVTVALDTPPQAEAGSEIPIRVVLTSNKVGHDYPTGPLDIIQSWVELRVTDSDGAVVFTSGTRDERHFIEPGSFLFKVEPVDEYGALIDRHNLWEMVGVRYRRALFPGYSDTAEYLVSCGSGLAAPPQPGAAPDDPRTEDFMISAPTVDTYTITAILHYRKVDQFLLNFLFGEESGLTAPVVELARATSTVDIVSAEM